MRVKASDFNARGRLLATTARRLLSKGYKYCPRHNHGEGEVLPVNWFALRGSGFGRCGYCRTCMSKYQHGKFVQRR